MDYRVKPGQVRAAKPGGGGGTAVGMIPVRVVASGTSPNFTYAIYAESDFALTTSLATGLTPDMRRMGPPFVPYNRPADGSMGAAYRDQNNAWKLYHVAQEIPLLDGCD